MPPALVGGSLSLVPFRKPTTLTQIDSNHIIINHINHIITWYQQFPEDNFNKWLVYVCVCAYVCVFACVRAHTHAWTLKGDRLQWGGGHASGERRWLREVEPPKTNFPPKCHPGSAWLTVKLSDGNESGGEGRKPRKPAPGVSRARRAGKRLGGESLACLAGTLTPPESGFCSAVLFFSRQQVRRAVFSCQEGFRSPSHTTKARSKLTLRVSPSDSDKSSRQPPASPLSLKAPQLKQFSTPPQRWAAACVSQSVTSSKFQGAEWEAGCARPTHTPSLFPAHTQECGVLQSVFQLNLAISQQEIRFGSWQPGA